MRAFPVLAAALLLAGCLAGQTPRPDYPAIEAELTQQAAQVLHLEHSQDGGHYRMALHALDFNVERVGYSNGVDNSGNPNAIPAAGSYTELAVTRDFAYLARSSPDGTFGGFSVIDIRDPAQPRVVGAFQGLGLGDVEVNDAETLAFASTQRNSPEQIVGRMADTGSPTTALPRGIYVVNISDKTFPTLDSFVPLPINGPHTLTYYQHPNGAEYLLACTYDLVTDPATNAIAGAVAATQRLLVYLIQPNLAAEGGAPGPKVALVPVAQFQISENNPPSTSGEEPRLVFPHDTRVHQDLEGRVLIDLAYWDKGVRMLDFTNPPAVGAANLPVLREVGGYTLFAPSSQNNIHLAKTFDEPMVDAKGNPIQVTVAEPEIINAEDESGYLTFIDSTDPARLTKLSHWTLPRVSPPIAVRNLDFSPHNFDTWDGKVALAHNHAGLWIIDVSDAENLAAPKTVGFYNGNLTRDNSPVYQPYFWGVFARNGLLFASDEATGLHVVRYTGP